jgi:hypothetical protein
VLKDKSEARMKKTIIYKLIFIMTVASQFSSAQTNTEVNCSTLTSRNEIYNGRTFTKYNVVDSAYMKCPQIRQTTPVMNWKVQKTTWSNTDESNFGIFLKKLGNSKCNTVDKCLAGNDNILRTEEDMYFTHYSDCADFPYYLRSYFAYKNYLPYSMVSWFKQALYTESQINQMTKERVKILFEKGEEAALQYDERVLDNRYSRNGNIPMGKLSVPSSTGAVRDFAVLGPKIMDQISSGTLRMLNGANGAVESDFYSPVVERSSIKAGTVLYNVAGHVAIVYDVTAKGEILFIDAHPDNSVSRGVFSPDFPLVKSVYGGNFKNFRPVEILNPVMDAEGFIIKGQVVAASDNQIPDFSVEQYEGQGKTSSNTTIFKLSPNDTKAVSFYDWVKFKLSGGTYRLDPVIEMQNEMNSLCLAAQDRVAAVQVAIDNQIHKKAHPDVLPNNIFGAEGEWEAYSTPGRDLRLKLKILGIPELAKTWMKRYQDKDPLISYRGQNLKSDLIAAYRQSVASCKITFKNSMGANTTIGLEALINRMAKVSYDPYVCPEIRWGAYLEADLATCVDSQEKREWSDLQQFLRNNLVKDTDAFHGYTLEELRRMNERKEVDNNSSSERYRINSKLEAM